MSDYYTPFSHEKEDEYGNKTVTQFEVQRNVDWETLKDNEGWLRASQEIFKAEHGDIPYDIKDPILSKYEGETYEEKLADYGLKQMAGFNYDLGEQVFDAKRILNAEQKEKEAFVYLLDQYNEVNTSWHTAKMAGAEMLSDATNWIGLATLGTGTLVAQGARMAGKKTLSLAIKNSIKNASLKKSTQKVGMLAGGEAAVHGVTGDYLDQSVRMDAGSQEEYDYKRTATAGAVSAVAGFTLGVGIDLGLSKLTAKQFRKNYADEAKLDDKAAKEQLEQADKIAKEQELREKLEAEGKSEAKIQEELEIKRFVEQNRSGKQMDLPLEDTTPKKRTRYVKGIREAFKSPKVIADNFVDSAKDTANKYYNEYQKQSTDRKQLYQFLKNINKAREIVGLRQVEFNKLLENKDLTRNQVKLLKNKQKQLRKDYESISKFVDSVNSDSGRNLELIQRYLNFKTRKGDVTGKALREARQAVLEHRRAFTIKSYETKIQKKLTKYRQTQDQKYLDDAMQQMQQRDRSLARIKEHMIDNDPSLAPKEKGMITKLGESHLEMSIAGVFSVKTVIVNSFFPFVKTYTYPLLEQIMQNAGSREMWRRTMLQYGQMLAANKAASRAARIAFDLEQTPLTADPARFLEGGIKTTVKGENKATAFLKKIGINEAAAFARVFPRALSATDAYMQEIASTGQLFVKVYDELLTEAIEKGLTPKQTKAYIDARVTDRMDESYTYALSMKSIKPIVDKGKGLGKTGDELDKYIKDQLQELLDYKPSAKELARFKADGIEQGLKGKKLQKYIDLRTERKVLQPLRTLDDELTLDMVKTLLYKKEFDKDGGFFEKSAGRLEEWQQSSWFWRWAGNLFYRTPVRLLEEGARLTPIINATMPNFQRDLMGANGKARQARAQAEAFISYAFMIKVLQLWTEGKVTGSPERDYLKTAENERTDALEPMEIEIFGEPRKYIWADPFRVPMMTFVNALDAVKSNELAKKEDYLYQVEFGKAPEGDFKQSQDALDMAAAVAMSSLVSAVRDSGVTSGLGKLMTTVQRGVDALDNPDEDEQERGRDVVGKFFFEKVLMPIPVEISKQQKVFGDADQKTKSDGFFQVLLKKVDPNNPMIGRQFDYFFNVTEVDEPAMYLNPFAGIKNRENSFRKENDKNYQLKLPNGEYIGRQQYIINYIASLESVGMGRIQPPKYRDNSLFGSGVHLNKIYTNYKGHKTSVMNAMFLTASDITNNGNLLADAIMPYVWGAGETPSVQDVNNKKGAIEKIKFFRNHYLKEALLTVVREDPKLLQMVKDKEEYDRQWEVIESQKLEFNITSGR